MGVFMSFMLEAYSFTPIVCNFVPSQAQLMDERGPGGGDVGQWISGDISTGIVTV